MTVKDEQLSPYTKALYHNLHYLHEKDDNSETPSLRRPRTRKLVPNLFQKDRYILHIRNLQM